MSVILPARGPSEAACRLTNQRMKTNPALSNKIAIFTPADLKVLYALPLSPAAAWSAFVSCGGRGE